ncbi:ImmA/IrrE family metallo-endopeptidase [Aliarcobacter butzleri]|uniref:ImmA/IrrE family metallo-endopeptidase n=1 Tax=Aliarcobacter butzleri TaxID=28197 RepID=A0AAW6VJJ2_9BACT|nr:ImmA/IrrE family metallo-endopeptidase [Aliarcobacter butzleri]MDK2042367.1 ImmA/IrrE family metallo-endopeptidase [Aliarcobacter butzleri]MDK2096703.1 ImmA/IrrE family metallo-endopeptidase [Aliarcobacter butzleri]
MLHYVPTDSDAILASKTDIQNYAENLAIELNYNYKNLNDVIIQVGAEIDFVNPLSDNNSFNGSMLVNKINETINISLSNLTGELRNNFTIAHELGHLYLHARNIKKDIIEFNRYGSGRLEWEANWFAAAFLMPEKIFIEKCNEFNSDNYELSLYFNVSESAIKIRKKDLGI